MQATRSECRYSSQRNQPGDLGGPLPRCGPATASLSPVMTPAKGCAWFCREESPRAVWRSGPLLPPENPPCHTPTHHASPRPERVPSVGHHHCGEPSCREREPTGTRCSCSCCRPCSCCGSHCGNSRPSCSTNRRATRAGRSDTSRGLVKPRRPRPHQTPRRCNRFTRSIPVPGNTGPWIVQSNSHHPE